MDDAFDWIGTAKNAASCIDNTVPVVQLYRVLAIVYIDNIDMRN